MAVAVLGPRGGRGGGDVRGGRRRAGAGAGGAASGSGGLLRTRAAWRVPASAAISGVIACT